MSRRKLTFSFAKPEKPDTLTFPNAAEILRKRGHTVLTMSGDKGLQALVDGTHSYSADELAYLVRRNLDPGTQIWSWVALDHEPELEATAVINAVAKAYQAKGRPEGVEVYRAFTTGGIMLYFSPPAARLNPNGFRAHPCVKPNLTYQKRIVL